MADTATTESLASTIENLTGRLSNRCEQLAGSLFTLLSHLGYEPEGEATPDELARLVDVAMEETASYKRLESEVRALTAALEDRQGRPSARRSLDRIARVAVASGMSPKDDLADYVCARLQERPHGLRDRRERDRIVELANRLGFECDSVTVDELYDFVVGEQLRACRLGVLAPVGAAIHDEERIRQIVRDELCKHVQDAVDTAKGRKPN